MCQQTDCLHLGCQHRFASPGPSSSSSLSSSLQIYPSTPMVMPPVFTHCPTLIAHRAKTHKLNFITRLFHNHYAPCRDFCLETRVVEGVCPTCAWQEKEQRRVREMVKRGEKRRRTLGLARTDDWDESME